MLTQSKEAEQKQALTRVRELALLRCGVKVEVAPWLTGRSALDQFLDNHRRVLNHIVRHRLASGMWWVARCWVCCCTCFLARKCASVGGAGIFACRLRVSGRAGCVIGQDVRALCYWVLDLGQIARGHADGLVDRFVSERGRRVNAHGSLLSRWLGMALARNGWTL